MALQDGDDIDFYNNLKRAVDQENDDVEDNMALDMRNPDMKVDFDDEYEDDFINDNSEGDDVDGFVQNIGNGMIDK
tara:strand:- start:146 stop:373 length:228 start_codon:yes stop_codon:yes gene_type:complete